MQVLFLYKLLRKGEVQQAAGLLLETELSSLVPSSSDHCNCSNHNASKSGPQGIHGEARFSCFCNSQKLHRVDRKYTFIKCHTSFQQDFPTILTFSLKGGIIQTVFLKNKFKCFLINTCIYMFPFPTTCII